MLPVWTLEVEETSSISHEVIIAMRSDFIPHPTLQGEGRCAICDLPYGDYVPREVAHHRGFHRRFLGALDDGWAPLPEETRSRLRRQGLDRQGRPDATFEERLAGATDFFTAKLHDYWFGVLYMDVPPTSVARYFVKRIDEKGLLDSYGQDVVEEMRGRYASDTVAVV